MAEDILKTYLKDICDVQYIRTFVLFVTRTLFSEDFLFYF